MFGWFDVAVTRRLLSGGSAGNKHLTTVVAAVLLLLLAIEGATLLNLRPLLTVHAFVGILLLPVVGLKLASTGWRMLRYYLGGDEYVQDGPPPVLLRTLVAPVLMLSTLVLFGTGVTLLALGRTEGTVVALHQASFVGWFGAAAVHVLVHVWKLPRLLRLRAAGAALRLTVVAGAVAVGLFSAVATLPAADHLQDQATAHLHVDAD
jgi:hypothetical protein